MSLNNRFVKVTLTMPGGDVVLTNELHMRIRIRKASLALQNRATVEISNLTTTLREQLLSQFSAFQRNQREQGTAANYQWIPVLIEAGYTQGGVVKTSVIFKGQVVLVDPISGPPNISVRITCYTRQLDRTTFVSSTPPSNVTYEKYVEWAAQQMGFGKSFICDTSYNNLKVVNPSGSLLTQAAILLDIQDMYKPDVAAFVDDDFLYVKDRNRIVNVDNISNIKEFVGTPQWTQWGVEFTTLFDQSIRLAQAATLTSVMNPSLNGTYVVMELAYDLDTREGPYYVTANGSPPA